jgi:hypothetical protein
MYADGDVSHPSLFPTIALNLQSPAVQGRWPRPGLISELTARPGTLDSDTQVTTKSFSAGRAGV